MHLILWTTENKKCNVAKRSTFVYIYFTVENCRYFHLFNLLLHAFLKEMSRHGETPHEVWRSAHCYAYLEKSDPTSALITNAFYLKNSAAKNNPDLYFFFVDVLCRITLSCIFSLKSISFSCFKGQQTDPKGPLQRA